MKNQKAFAFEYGYYYYYYIYSRVRAFLAAADSENHEAVPVAI